MNARVAFPVHEVGVDLVVARNSWTARLMLRTGDSAFALRELDSFYDRVRVRLATYAAAGSWPWVCRFAVTRETPLVHATTEGVAEAPMPEAFGSALFPRALEIMDRCWIRHRASIARFAAQEKL